MVSTLCTFTIFNIIIQVVSIVLNFVYFSWAALGKWFEEIDKSDINKLKQTVDSIELYINTVEYTSLAMIPIQITIIIMLKCCCTDCQKCKKNLENTEFDVDNFKNNMNMHQSEFVV
jgi:hypothetical protein